MTLLRPQRAPEDWTARVPGQGSCFHQALDRWLLMHSMGELGFRIGLGVVEVNPFCLTRHLHAWLERDDQVVSAPFGSVYTREDFYTVVGIEHSTIRLVSPRKILRRARGRVDNDTVTALLNLWGRPWKVLNGGIVPGDA